MDGFEEAEPDGVEPEGCGAEVVGCDDAPEGVGVLVEDVPDSDRLVRSRVSTPVGPVVAPDGVDPLLSGVSGVPVVRPNVGSGGSVMRGSGPDRVPVEGEVDVVPVEEPVLVPGEVVLEDGPVVVVVDGGELVVPDVRGGGGVWVGACCARLVVSRVVTRGSARGSEDALLDGGSTAPGRAGADDVWPPGAAVEPWPPSVGSATVESSPEVESSEVESSEESLSEEPVDPGATGR